MKKSWFIFVAFLTALAVMAPGPPEKAEKVRINDQDWDIQPFFYPNADGTFTWGLNLDGIDIKYGIATAGEHAAFNLGVTLSGVMIDDNNWDLDWSRTILVSFSKDPEGVKDADGYIGVVTDEISWNGDDDGSGYVVDQVALALVAPGGTPMGESCAVDTGWVLIAGSNFDAPVMIDDNGWDYNHEHNAIVVPLLAQSSLLDDMQSLGYLVTIDVDVWNLDGSFAGSGRGTREIVAVDPIDWDYVQIQPVFATLDSDVGWNGDDDGSGIVTGLIDLVDPATGNVVNHMVFTDQTVGFTINSIPELCPGCDAP